jgi:tripartite-type tricarboxylate transporter receptor subunit TctC
MFVLNSLPTKSVMELVAYAKAHPGKLTLASPGTGSTPHLAGELLKQMTGIEMTHVPYRGASPALNDLIPDRVDCYFGSGALLENMRSGQVRGLAAEIAHDGRGRLSGLRDIVVARLVRAGQDAA